MGSSWWAIGSKDFGTYMTSLKTTLVVPESVNNNNTQGVMAINTAVENSVRKPVASHISSKADQLCRIGTMEPQLPRKPSRR